MTTTSLRFFCDTRRHLVCLPYSRDNLHVMAAELGIKRCWYHGGNRPHYDIPKGRVDDVTARCEVVPSRQILEIIRGGEP